MTTTVRTDGHTWHAVAEALHGIADDLATLADTAATAPHVCLDIQPASGSAADAVKVAAVDTVAAALLDRAGRTQRAGGAYHHSARNYRGPVQVAVYAAVTTSPAERDLHAEIDRLRAELAAAGSGRDPEPTQATPLPEGVAAGCSTPLGRHT